MYKNGRSRITSFASSGFTEEALFSIPIIVEAPALVPFSPMEKKDLCSIELMI